MEKQAKRGHSARRGKRRLVLLLCMCLIGTMTPVTPDTPAASVNGKGLGVSIIANPTVPKSTDSAWKGSYVYFGTYDNNTVKYRVLDRNTTAFNENETSTMLLDCDSILWAGSDPSSAFDDKNSNIWANSTICAYLNNTFLKNTDSFTNPEKAAIAESTKREKSNTDGNGWSYLNYAALNGDQIFLLDAEEATNTSYGYSNTDNSATNREKTGGCGNWWLRSANSSDGINAGFVYSDGDFCLSYVAYYDVGMSPALNVDLSAVIFSTVISGDVGQAGAEYKLTLHDSNMTITPGTITRDRSDGITVSYTIEGANAANATKVSLMVLDKEYEKGNTNGAKLIAYEKIADVNTSGTIGTGTFTLPKDLKDKTCGTDYFAYIIAEEVNDGNQTDYASGPEQITISDFASTFTVTVENGTLNNGNNSGNITLASFLNLYFLPNDSVNLLYEQDKNDIS